MVAPAHIGLDHPNLVWLVVVGLIAFITGLGVNLSRSTDEAASNQDPGTGDESLE